MYQKYHIIKQVVRFFVPSLFPKPEDVLLHEIFEQSRLEQRRLEKNLQNSYWST